MRSEALLRFSFQGVRTLITIKFSEEEKGRFGIVGHVGVGHVHSHSGFVQDDSVGFAVAAHILKQAVPTDTIIEEAYADVNTNSVTVITKAGGKATLSPRRGITPREAEIITSAKGLDASYSQNCAIDVFGRIYGQGAAELQVCFQGVCALAVLESFKKTAGEKLSYTTEKFENKYDVSAATVLDIDGIPVSLMLVINGTNGGIGPDEDYEGNANWTEKGELMHKFALDSIPTTVIESKAFIPGMADTVSENQWMVRAQENIDCTILGESLYASAKELELPVRYETGLMPMPNGALERATVAFADKIIDYAEKLKTADSCADKTVYVAEIAKLISEDAGGVTFMSNSVNDKVRGAGTLPKISAVLSMVTTREYQAYWKIPQVTAEETENYAKIVIKAIKNLAEQG